MADKKRRRVDSPQSREISADAARKRLQITADFLEANTTPIDSDLRTVASLLRAFLEGEYRTLDAALGFVGRPGAPKSKASNHARTAQVIFNHWTGDKCGNVVDWPAVLKELQRPDGSEPDLRELRRIWKAKKNKLIAEAINARLKDCR